MDIFNSYDDKVKHVLKLIKNDLIQNNIKGYIVGGAVRDALLDMKCNDIDICVECNPIEIIKRLKEVDKYTYYNKFQTSTVVFKNGVEIDLIRCRNEVYNYNGALPTVTPSNVKDDLKRRDFTINSLAYDLINNHIIDLYNGIFDLKNKKLKKIKMKSYEEDPTRIFRGIKYAVRYNFNLYDYKEIKNCINKNVFDTISNDRIVKEIIQISNEQKWIMMFDKCDEFNIINLNTQCLGLKNKLFSYDDINLKLINLFLSLQDNKYKNIMIDNSILNRDMKNTFSNIITEKLYYNLKAANDNYDIFNVLKKCSIYDLMYLSFYKIFIYKIINFLILKDIPLQINGNIIKSMGIYDGKEIGNILRHINRLELNAKITIDSQYINKNLGEILDGVKYKNTEF